MQNITVEVNTSAEIVYPGNPEGNSIDFMYAANGAFLAMAIINWVLMWPKYFLYVWFGLGY